MSLSSRDKPRDWSAFRLPIALFCIYGLYPWPGWANVRPSQLGNRRDLATLSSLSFAVAFGKIVARLDLLAQMLDERYRRIGLNYAQSLLLMNVLPVQWA